MVIRLPIVTYEHKKWFFDERLRQIRNVKNPHEWIDLDEVEMEYSREKVRKGDVRTSPSLINWLTAQSVNYAAVQPRLHGDGERVALLTRILVPYAATSPINSGIGYYSRRVREY